MVDYVYTDHAQYTIKTYAKMALFPLVLTGPLSTVQIHRIALRLTELWRRGLGVRRYRSVPLGYEVGAVG